MDSRNIFIAASRLNSKIEWQKKSSDSEWFYTGLDDGFKRTEVNGLISSFFAGEEIYLVLGRRNSKIISKEKACNEIKCALSNEKSMEVFLCDKNFKKMIEFNKIGVARYGTV